VVDRYHRLGGDLKPMNCPKCGSEMIQELRPSGRWYRVKWYCVKCGHEEKVKPCARA